MARKILAVWGKADLGKTMAIRAVCDKMLKNGGKLLSFDSDHDMPTPKNLSDLNVKGDITAVVEYKGIKIGINSPGDPGCETQMAEAIVSFKSIECTVVICATRTKGKTVKTVESFESDFEITWFHEIDASNHINADELWKRLNEIIKEIAGK